MKNDNKRTSKDDAGPRKQTGEEPRPLEFRCRATIDAASDAIHILDSNLRFVFCNQAFKEWCYELGLETDVIGKKISDVFAFLTGKVLDEYRRVLRTGESLTTEETTQIGERELITETRKIPIFEQGRVDRVITAIHDVTEGRRAKQMLEEANRLLEGVLEHTHMMVACLDPRFNFVKVNRAYAEADGRLPSFFPGKNHFDLYPNAENQKIFQRVVDTGKPYFAYAKPFEYAEHPERGVSYWDWSLIPVEGPMGAVTGLVLTLVNVTERERTEKALRESEERLRRFMESATDSFVLWDKELNLVEANEAALKTFAPGVRKTKVIGKNLLELVPEVKKTGRYGRYLEVIKTAKPFRVDDVILDPKFGERRVAVRAFKVGEGLGMVVTDITERKLAEEALKKACDELEIRVQERTRELSAANIELREEIAERKQAEESLRASREDYRTLVETSRDMIFTVDLNGAFLFTNRAFEEILGYNPKEIRKINGFELIHPEESESVGKQFARLVQGESVDNMEYRYRRKDGSYISILNNASPIFDAEGNVVAAFGVARDITRRKRAERELTEYRDHLRELVEERTAELRKANQQLEKEIAERKRAEEELRAEKEFTDRALNAQTDTFFVFEPSSGRAVRWNRAFVEVSGYSDEEIRSMKAPGSYYDEEDLKKAAAAAEKVLREGIATVELSLITKHGRSIPTEYTASAIRDSEGNPKYIIAVGRDITERRRAEEKIKQQNEFLNNIIESLTHPFWVVDAYDYTIRAANSAALQDGLLGSSTCYTLSHGRNAPCDGSEHPCPLTEVKKTKRPVAVEHVHYDKEGNPRVVQVYGYPIFDHQGNVAQMIEYSLDVTERREAEKSLRESEEKFRSLAEQSPNMIFINKKGRVVYANRRCEEITGWKREEFYSPNFDFLDLIAPESKDLVKENFSRHTRNEEVQPYEYTLYTKDGRHIEAILNSKLITYGGEAAILGIVTDITERKRAEEELRKRTRDLNERVKELNCLYGIGRLIETPGISLEDIFQGTIDLIPAATHYPDVACARLALGDQIFVSRNFSESRWRISSDIIVHGNREGNLEVYYLQERPQRDEGPFVKEEVSLLKIIVERLGRVIERNRAEKEIKTLNRSLQTQAAQLAAANKELEAFSYSVSHDLRAPLRTADGFSRALMEDYPDKLDERGKDYLTRIRTATQRMGRLVDDLLNLSMTMRKEMRREQIDLSQVAGTIAGELKKTQPERQVEFIIQQGVLAHGDASLIREVLENLLRNAWKFTGKHARARIEFGAAIKNGEMTYYVQDDGVGFDAKYAHKLFVPFQRLHSADEFPGNGVGLALVSRIIDRHGGRVYAEGEVEKGATFYFTLP